MEKFMAFMDKLSGPLTTFSEYKLVKGIQNGLVGTVSITIVGSMFLLLNVLSKVGQFSEGFAVLPFLSSLSSQFSLVNGMTVGIIGLYSCVSIGICYGEQLKMKPVSCAMVSILAFVLLTNAGTFKAAVDETTFTVLNVGNWGGGGIIVAMLGSLLSVHLLYFCDVHNIKIRMPEMVPPAIAESFSSLISLFFVAVVCWTIKSIIGFDIANAIKNILVPVFSAADNIFVYTLTNTLAALFWTVGLHGENITGAVTGTVTAVWTAENQAAALAGQAIPYVWYGNTLIGRLCKWVSSVWPILFLILTSKKLKHMHPFAIASTPAAIFGIVEPVVFGLPIVMNPYFMISLVLSHAVTSFITYGSMAIGLVGRMYISLPWCMPAPIIGLLSTGGDIRGVILVVVNFLVGLVITYPFFKAYEKSEVEKMEAREAELKELETIA